MKCACSQADYVATARRLIVSRFKASASMPEVLQLHHLKIVVLESHVDWTTEAGCRHCRLLQRRALLAHKAASHAITN